MEDDGLRIDDSAFQEACARALTQSRREPMVYMREQARGVVRKIIGITPPAHITQIASSDEEGNSAWNVVQGGAAKSHGATAVQSDIRRLYGSSSASFELAASKETHHGQAKGLYGQITRGELDRARDLFRAMTGASLAPFDGGKLHRARRSPRTGRVGKRKKPVYYLTDDAPLAAYMKQKAAKVGWLAAGWNQAAAALGVQSPAWIWRHSAPGRGEIIAQENSIIIRMVNQVSFAANIADFERRVQYALDSQAAAINRRSLDFIRKTFNSPGFTFAPEGAAAA